LPFNNRLDEAVRTERGRLRRACPEKLSPSGDRERHNYFNSTLIQHK
jgi:hypothetical protein